MKLSLYALVFVSAITSGGCGQGAIYYYAGPEFSPTQRASLYIAAERWNRVAIQKQFITEDENEATDHILLTHPDKMSILHSDGVHEDPSPFRGGVIHLNPLMTPARFQAVATHEMGHALGLGLKENGMDHHLAPPKIGVMGPAGNRIRPEDDTITEDDIGECRRVHACN